MLANDTTLFRCLFSPEHTASDKVRVCLTVHRWIFFCLVDRCFTLRSLYALHESIFLHSSLSTAWSVAVLSPLHGLSTCSLSVHYGYFCAFLDCSCSITAGKAPHSKGSAIPDFKQGPAYRVLQLPGAGTCPPGEIQPGLMSSLPDFVAKNLRRRQVRQASLVKADLHLAPGHSR